MLIDGLNASFNGADVLKDFSVELPDAGRVCFFGPSGCGKTTLLRAVSDRLTTAGMKVAWVFQEDRSFLEHGFENAAVSGAKKEEVNALLDALGYRKRRKRGPPSFRAGCAERRRSSALAFGGDALILDEPFKGLDEASRAAAVALIRKRGPNHPSCHPRQGRGRNAGGQRLLCGRPAAYAYKKGKYVKNP
jgi:ABC-type nitrate/sulfonate/bicarbonate transport system ATPase subunit